MTNPAILLGLAAATLVSEDLTLVSAGLLARDGAIGLVPAIAACAAGVYLGDLALWAGGRLVGRRVFRFGFVSRRIDEEALVSLGARVDAHLGLAVFASRFLPGSRLPLYLTVGICGQRPLAFAVWSLFAVLLWTPALVWLTQSFGSLVSVRLLGELNGALRHLISAIVLCTAWRVIVRVMGKRLRASL